MGKRAQLNTLESRQLELQAKMKSLDYINNKISDAYYLHGAQAAKNIAEYYRSKLEEREGWREEFNQNQEAIAVLKEEIAAEEAEAALHPAEPVEEPEPEAAAEE